MMQTIAMGDAWGLPCEGMGPRRARWWLDVERGVRFRFFGALSAAGVVSDDTEQTALVLQSILRAQRDGGDVVEGAARHLRRAMIAFVARLPFGVGLGTLRAVAKLTLGAQHGVHTAGNGAAMRAGFIGLLIDDADTRRRLGRALAEVTHTHPQGIEGALWLAELVHLVAHADPDVDDVKARRQWVRQACDAVVQDDVLGAAILNAASTSSTTALPTTGYIVHSTAVVAQDFVLHGHRPLQALQATIERGGDADTHAAMLGAVVGAGRAHEDHDVIAAHFQRLLPGPFGPHHLMALVEAIDPDAPVPSIAHLRGGLRSLLLMPLVLLHGFARLLPPYG